MQADVSQCSAGGQSVLTGMGREHALGASWPAVLLEEHSMRYGSVYYQEEKSDHRTVTSGIMSDRDILLPSSVIIKLLWCYDCDCMKHYLPCHTCISIWSHGDSLQNENVMLLIQSAINEDQ